MAKTKTVRVLLRSGNSFTLGTQSEVGVTRDGSKLVELRYPKDHAWFIDLEQVEGVVLDG